MPSTTDTPARIKAILNRYRRAGMAPPSDEVIAGMIGVTERTVTHWRRKSRNYLQDKKLDTFTNFRVW